MNIELTSEIKNIISTSGLVSSGKLLNSTYIDIKINNKIFINIVTTDYFVYVHEDYRIIEQFVNTIAFKNYLENEYVQIINDQLEKVIKGIPINDIPFDYNPVILINGY